jgi:hypothetical protein
MRTDLILIRDGDEAFATERSRWSECPASNMANPSHTEAPKCQVASLRKTVSLSDAQLTASTRSAGRGRIRKRTAEPPLMSRPDTAARITDSICVVEVEGTFEPVDQGLLIPGRLGARAGPRQPCAGAGGSRVALPLSIVSLAARAATISCDFYPVD